MAAPLPAQVGGNNALSCTASVPAPATLRSEGFTERIGDIVLTCTGGTPTPAGAPVPAANFTISLAAQITSRIYPNGWSEALLLVDEPGVPQRAFGDNPPITTTPLLACGEASGICSINGTRNGIGTYNALQAVPTFFRARCLATRSSSVFRSMSRATPLPSWGVA